MTPVKHSGKFSSLKSKWAISRTEVIIFAITIVVTVCLLLPVVSHHTSHSSRELCRHGMTQIGIALENYHSAYGSYPPAFVTNGEEQPLYSWRVLLLPYLDENLRYDKFRLNEPWDSAYNASWSEKKLVYTRVGIIDRRINLTIWLSLVRILRGEELHSFPKMRLPMI